MEADRGGPVVEIIDLDASDPASGPVDHDRSTARRGGPAAPLILVAAVALAGWLLAAGGPGPIEQSSRSNRPSASGPPVTSLSPATLTAGLVPAFQVVVTSPSGDGARLVAPRAAGGYLIHKLPPLTDYAFDASGRWLAGLDPDDPATGQPTLWIGPPEGPLEPAASGVRSFAWHDTEPGIIGWSWPGDDEVVIWSLEQVDRPDLATATVAAPAEGRLRGLGDWGLAIETSTADVETITTIVDLDGAVVAELPGRYRGRLAGGDLVVGGGVGPPLRYSTLSREANEIAWMGADDDLWAVVAPIGGGVTVAVVVRDGDPARPVRAEVIRIDQGEATIEARLDAASPVGLSEDGSIVVAEPDGDALGQPLVLRVIGAAAHPGLILPDVFPGAERVAAMTVD